MLGDASTPVASRYPFHLITENLPMTFFPGAVSITELGTGTNNLTVRALLLTSSDSWAETNLDLFFDKSEVGLSEEDVKGPVSIAVAVTAQVEDAEEEAGEDKESSWWRQLNPVNWFDKSESSAKEKLSEEPAPQEEEAEQDKESSFWRQLNPVNWFDKSESSEKEKLPKGRVPQKKEAEVVKESSWLYLLNPLNWFYVSESPEKEKLPEEPAPQEEEAGKD
jgi:hypothetical protein